MRRSLKACFALFRIRVAESLQYRASALAGASVGVFWALIEIAVYSIFYKHAQNAQAASLTLGQMVSYIWMGQILWVIQFMNIDGDILSKITNGDVGVELCRPIDLYFHWFSKSAAGRLGGFWWRGTITVIAGLLMPAAYRLSAPASIAGFIFFLLSAVSAFLLCASYGMLITAIRLGITWGDGPTYILMLFSGVLSGGYLPLQMWPDFLQGFLLVQPFPGNLDLPLRLYVGSMPPEQAVFAISLQLGWTVVFILTGRMIMRRKLKTIIVQGG